MAKGADLYGTYGGSPDVLPSGPATPAMNVQAPPTAFGAGIGEAVEKAGAAATDLAEKYRTMAIEAKANDTISTGWGPAVAKLTGDYRQLQGKDAIAGYQPFVDNLNNLRAQYIATATTPAEKNILGNYMTHHVAQELDSAQRWQDSQMTKYEDESANSFIKEQVNRAVGAGDNMAAVEDAFTKGSAMYQKHGMDRGLDQQTIDQNKKDFVGKVSAGIVERAVEGGDLQFANRFYSENKDKIEGESQLRIEKILHTQNVANFEISSVDQLMAGKKPAPLSGVLSEPLSSATKESAPAAVKTGVTNTAIDWTMAHEGGFVASDSGKGPTNFGINQESNRGIDVTKLTREGAAKIMHDKYWLGVGADKMSPQLAAVAFDGAVNQGISKIKTLLAQSGDDPQKLIDLRRAEYQRLATANPEKYGASINGWNKRLDDLQAELSNISTVQPVTHEGGLPSFKPSQNPVQEYKNWQTVETPYIEYANSIDNPIERKAVLDGIKERSAFYQGKANRYSSAIVSGAQMRMADPDFNYHKWVQENPDELAELTISHPQTVNELRNKAEANAKYGFKEASRVTDINSQNFYGNLQRTLLPVLDSQGNFTSNRISNEAQLHGLLGRSDGSGINLRDVADLKKSMDLDDTWKRILLKNMNDIELNNGNIDGGGKQRSQNFFKQAMKLNDLEQNTSVKKLTPAETEEYLSKMKGNFMISRASQISNLANAGNRNIPSVPSVGDIIDGYKFLGGNPANKESWGKI